MFLKSVKIQRHERGLVFRSGELRAVLRPGRHLLRTWPFDQRLLRVSMRAPIFYHPDLEVIARSDLLKEEAVVLDLGDHQRALVWVDGRFAQICGPGLHLFWQAFHTVRTEVIDARSLRFEHAALATILEAPDADQFLQRFRVDAGSSAVLFVDGRHRETLQAGTHVFWKDQAHLRVVALELREKLLDIASQEVTTADKVSLRLNAVVAFKVSDPLQALTSSEDFQQSLYREAQLVLRTALGARGLDDLLASKEKVAEEMAEALRPRAQSLGLEIVTLGLRDLILPGEMRQLMNRVTEAQKAAEANLIARREETAAMRSQANTARLLEQNPTLMRLRELEVLEKVAESSNLSVMLGEAGLTERIMKLV